MAQIGFGIGQGPNGPQMIPVIMPSQAPAEPESYESHLETPEGVYVKITYNTKNKVMADRYADELAQKSGWRVLEKAPEAPMSLASEIGLSWMLAFIAAFVLPFVLIFGAEILRSAGYMNREWSDMAWNNAAKIGIWSFVGVGITFTTLSLLQRSTETQHD